MKPTGGVIVYRCRRCGELVKTLHSPDYSLTVICVVTGTKDPHASGISAHATGTHLCKDNAVGVTDIIGGEPDKEEA